MKAGFVPLALVSAVLALSGCSSTGSGGTPLIPDKAIQLTAGTAVSMSTLAAAAALSTLQADDPYLTADLDQAGVDPTAGWAAEAASDLV